MVRCSTWTLPLIFDFIPNPPTTIMLLLSNSSGEPTMFSEQHLIIEKLSFLLSSINDICSPSPRIQSIAGFVYCFTIFWNSCILEDIVIQKLNKQMTMFIWIWFSHHLYCLSILMIVSIDTNNICFSVSHPNFVLMFFCLLSINVFCSVSLYEIHVEWRSDCLKSYH